MALRINLVDVVRKIISATMDTAAKLHLNNANGPDINPTGISKL